MAFPDSSPCPWRLERPSSPSSGSRNVFRHPTALPPAPLGKIRKEVCRDLPTTGFREDEIRISNCKVVSSYNWMENPQGSIKVPGMPARWTPLPEPEQLKKDRGTYYRDRNAASHSKYPLEPAIHSILEMEQDITRSASFGAVDVFGCATALGNLFRFIRGRASSFRILVEVVGSTVHLVHRERSPFDTTPNVRGYKHSFSSAYTTWDPEVRGSSSHQRIVSYRLGGLGLFCLFEGDGYLPRDSDTTRPNAHGKRKEEVSTPSADHLLLADLSVSCRASSSDDADALPGDEPELKVSAAGNLTHQDSVFELKTRSIKQDSEQNALKEYQLRYLWLRQVPNLVLAYHNSGTFTDIRVMDVRSDVRKWEERRAPEIKKFIGLLRQIVDAARDGAADDDRLEITYEEGANSVCIREQEPGLPELLPQATLERWETWLNERYLSHFDWDDDQPGFEDASDDESDDGYERLDDYTACDDECGYCGECEWKIL
ncbi:hypothetical protein E4U53_006084 [Claviceps sorghi]|nr:hypothetical protein E4U53_006084 [Claviceps sorghi]